MMSVLLWHEVVSNTSSVGTERSCPATFIHVPRTRIWQLFRFVSALWPCHTIAASQLGLDRSGGWVCSWDMEHSK